MLGHGNPIAPYNHPWSGAERLVVFGNPYSSRFEAVTNKLDILRAEQPEILKDLGITEVEVVETKPLCEENQLLFNQLQRGDAVAVIGGDGTVSSVLRAAYKTNYYGTLALLGGGNANDVERMANGRSHRNLGAIFGQTKSRALYPLKVDAHQDDRPPINKLAFGYFSLGYTAMMSAFFNDPGYRQRTSSYRPSVRLITEVGSLLSMLPKATQFEVQDEHGSRVLAEQVFMNGSRMAKHMRSRQSLFEAGAVYAGMPRADLLNIGLGLGRLSLGLTPQLHPGAVYQAQILPKAEPLRLEVDGETSKNDLLFSSTKLTVQPAIQPVMLLSK